MEPHSPTNSLVSYILTTSVSCQPSRLSKRGKAHPWIPSSCKRRSSRFPSWHAALPQPSPRTQNLARNLSISRFHKVNTSGVPSSQEPTTTSNDKNEVENIRWSTGVRRHMMDVFRADPFATMDLLLLTLLSLLSVVRLPSMALSAQTGNYFVSCRWRSADTLSHPNSLDRGRRAAKSERAFRLLSSHFAPLAHKKCMHTNLRSTLTPRSEVWKSHTSKTTGGTTGLRCRDWWTATRTH